MMFQITNFCVNAQHRFSKDDWTKLTISETTYITFRNTTTQFAAYTVRTNKHILTLYRMVMPIGTPFLKEKNNN